MKEKKNKKKHEENVQNHHKNNKRYKENNIKYAIWNDISNVYVIFLSISVRSRSITANKNEYAYHTC